MKKLIITVATTGAYGTKEHSPYIPITPEEIVKEVADCAEAGASISHLHARDRNGEQSLDPGIFSQIVTGIRAKCPDLILNISTAGNVGDEERMAPIALLKPELASFDCGSMNWNNHHVFLNAPQFLEKLGRSMEANGIKPEIEIFDMGMMGIARHYIKTGIIKAPAHFQFVLGVMGGIDASVKNLLALYEMLPENATWGAFGVGANSLPILYTSIALGATMVRVGMEDTLYYTKGRLAQSNRELVERAVRIAKEFGREIATPDEARSMLFQPAAL